MDKSQMIGNSKLTVESVIQLGLFRWKPNHTSVGILECPFVFVWLLATWSGDAALVNFRLPAYDEIRQQSAPDLPLGLQCWQNWEEVPSRFRMLKSSLLVGNMISFGDLHAGALMSKQTGNIKVKVTALQNLLRATKQYATKGNPRSNMIEHQLGTDDVQNCNCFFLNGYSATAADGFCGVILEDDKIVRELHQYKHIQKKVSVQLLQSEYNIAANTHDFFILFTTHKSAVEERNLPPNTALVCEQNFSDYFGPFAARAFQRMKININTATRTQLQSMEGIGVEGANRLLDNRRVHGVYKDSQDCFTRTGVFMSSEYFPEKDLMEQ